MAALPAEIGVEEAGPYGIVTLPMRGTTLNMLSLAAGASLLGGISVHLFLENVQPRIGG